MNRGEQAKLSPSVSPLGAWSLSVGTAIGWGSLVITCNTFLVQAGPNGSVLGMVVGALIMLVVGWNYHFLINRYPDAGGSYAYVRNVFGYDYGFLVAWFLGLTYLAIFWANATSLPLFARLLLGDAFRFGYLYSFLRYDVYAGEVLLTVTAIVLAGLLCANAKRLSLRLNVMLAFVFIVGITVVFAVSMTRHFGGYTTFQPVVIPMRSLFSQVFAVACMAPWAFVGFENISNASEEFSFGPSRVLGIVWSSVVIVTLLYIFVTLTSVASYPGEYRNWLAYLLDLPNVSGLKGIPAFFVANHFMGDAGVGLMGATLLALVVTSLIGNLTAVSRLLFSLARDGVLSPTLTGLNDQDSPHKAIWLAVGMSCLIPFVGRTAIGWIVDVNTIGATLVYCFVCAAVIKIARAEKNRTAAALGTAGLALMTTLGLLTVSLNIADSNAISTESYILFTVWSLLGLVSFCFLLSRDTTRRFGKSSVAWVVLLSITTLMAIIWMRQADQGITDEAMRSIQDYFARNGSGIPQAMQDAYVANALAKAHGVTKWNIFLVMGLFGIGLTTIILCFGIVRRREHETRQQLDTISTVAFTDALTGVKSKYSYVDWEQSLNLRIDDDEVERFAIVVCDINDLKIVNDTQGHKAGDAHIKSASDLICRFFKHSPVFRIGGDEFVVILEGSDFENRHHIMADLNRIIDSNAQVGGVVVSAGISDYARGTDRGVQTVFERADAAMYARKQQLKG